MILKICFLFPIYLFVLCPFLIKVASDLSIVLVFFFREITRILIYSLGRFIVFLFSTLLSAVIFIISFFVPFFSELEIEIMFNSFIFTDKSVQ